MKSEKVSEGNKEQPIFGEWQLCPKCNGSGQVYENRGTPGLTDYTVGWFNCDVCNGAKVLARPIINSKLLTNGH